MKIEVIGRHVLIDGVYPAIIMEDGTIRVMVRMGVYWTEKQFKEEIELGHIPKSKPEIDELLAIYRDYNK